MKASCGGWVHASRHGAILGLGDGFRADVNACQHHAVPYTEHGQGDCEDRFGSASSKRMNKPHPMVATTKPSQMPQRK